MPWRGPWMCRVKAEKEIACEAENIHPGAMRRLKALADRGLITQRGFELVELWDGVGARGRRPGEGEYHSIRELLKSLSSLPDVDRLGHRLVAEYRQGRTGRWREKGSRPSTSTC